MFRKLLKKIENLEDALVECAEMNAMVLSAGKFFACKNEAHLREKEEAKKTHKAHLLNFSRSISGWC